MVELNGQEVDDEVYMEILNRGINEGMAHVEPSPETKEKLAILDTNFEHINEDLKDIKSAITRSTIWLISTLFTILVASFSLAFWLGSWKGNIEQKIYIIEKNQEKDEQNETSLREDMRNIARDEITNFANKNFDYYKK